MNTPPRLVVVLAVCHNDFHLAEQWLSWAAHLAQPAHEYRLIVWCTKSLEPALIARLRDRAEKFPFFVEIAETPNDLRARLYAVRELHVSHRARALRTVLPWPTGSLVRGRHGADAQGLGSRDRGGIQRVRETVPRRLPRLQDSAHDRERRLCGELATGRAIARAPPSASSGAGLGQFVRVPDRPADGAIDNDSTGVASTGNHRRLGAGKYQRNDRAIPPMQGRQSLIDVLCDQERIPRIPLSAAGPTTEAQRSVRRNPDGDPDRHAREGRSVPRVLFGVDRQIRHRF
jgi:hypothetical protein